MHYYILQAAKIMAVTLRVELSLHWLLSQA